MKVGIVLGKGSAKPEADSERDKNAFLPVQGPTLGVTASAGVSLSPPLFPSPTPPLHPRLRGERGDPSLATIAPPTRSEFAVWKSRSVGGSGVLLEGSLTTADQRALSLGVASQGCPSRNEWERRWEPWVPGSAWGDHILYGCPCVGLNSLQQCLSPAVQPFT